MYVNGSRITSQLQRVNKRLSMRMSKHLHCFGLILFSHNSNLLFSKTTDLTSTQQFKLFGKLMIKHGFIAVVLSLNLDLIL